MQCPHCRIHFHDNWTDDRMMRHGNGTGWTTRMAVCPGCNEDTIELRWHGEEWSRIYPRATARAPVPPQVPAHIRSDYEEACIVLPLSPKASAALARRCLQTILRDHGYKAKDLSKEIDLLLNESDSKKAIPSALRDTVDGIRNFGNFSAHPITDVTTLQIIDVQPHEAEWCLEIIEEMFDHFYVRPVAAAAKKAALDAKLAAAGKPNSK